MWLSVSVRSVGSRYAAGEERLGNVRTAHSFSPSCAIFSTTMSWLLKSVPLRVTQHRLKCWTIRMCKPGLFNAFTLNYGPFSGYVTDFELLSPVIILTRRCSGNRCHLTSSHVFMWFSSGESHSRSADNGFAGCAHWDRKGDHSQFLSFTIHGRVYVKKCKNRAAWEKHLFKQLLCRFVNIGFSYLI